MITTKDQLEDVLKRNILERDVLTTFTIGEVIDKLEYGEIAVPYYPEGTEDIIPKNNVLCGYIYYDSDGYLKGMDLSDGYTAKVNVFKSANAVSKHIILNTYDF